MKSAGQGKAKEVKSKLKKGKRTKEGLYTHLKKTCSTLKKNVTSFHQ